jgi:predicted Rossmann fold nucleotide-binding protein DprA/Smf involved in DNA uptake
MDRCAHEAALVAGIPTLAVLGSGHEHLYPPEAEPLRQKIIHAGGLIISEFPPSTPPKKHQFVQRNRCLAVWAKAVCVIEAPARSGALITADYALENHVSVFAVPSFPGDPPFLGNQRLLDEHSALALWGAHSLGAVWLELATLRNPQDLFPQVEAYHLRQLREWAQKRVDLSDKEPLLTQAHQAGWSSSLFFATWEQAIKLGIL